MSTTIIPAALPVLSQSSDEIAGLVLIQQTTALRLTKAGQLVWRHAFLSELPENEGVLAQLDKGEDFNAPEITLVGGDKITPQDQERIQGFLKQWLRQFTAPLHEMRHKLKAAAQPVPVQTLLDKVAEHDGLLPRRDVADLVKGLDSEQRKLLRDQDVYIRANVIFCRAALKPAVVKAKAALWRLWHEDARPAAPPEGNVSAPAVPSEGAPKGFYDYIGFPLCGELAVRIDMQERVLSQLYDGAQRGCYVLTPHLASLIGASVDGLCKVIEALGFQPARPLAGIDSAPLPEDPESYRPLHIYHVTPPRIVAKGGARSTAPKRSKKPGRSHGKAKPRPANKYDPDSPFAKLKDLKLG